ncbi:MAG: hypothetical protein SVP52_02550 [Chloroflexota bacterium]|nr:hypothetical protein [Chloroflexota bacterium]
MSERKVCIVGIGSTLHSVLPTRSWRSLLVESVNKALDDANLTIDDVNAGYLSMGSHEMHGQNHPAGMANWEIGMWPKGLTHIENACASGTTATRAGWLNVLSGKSDIVLVAGVDKNTDNVNAWQAIGAHTDVEWEYNFGLAWGPLMAHVKRLHMKTYGSTDEQWLTFPVTLHEYAVKNPYCNQYGKKPLTLEDVKNSPPLYGPARMIELCPMTDGSTSVILASEDVAKKLTKKPLVYIEHIAMGSDPQLLGNRWRWGDGKNGLLQWRGEIEASNECYRKAGITPDDIDLCTVHDSGTVVSMVHLENMGIFKQGEAPRMVYEGQTRIGGKCPCSTHGGMRWLGHPIGASGLNQVHELTLQLRGDAEKDGRQVPNAEFGMFSNEGSNGASMLVGILKRGG